MSYTQVESTYRRPGVAEATTYTYGLKFNNEAIELYWKHTSLLDNQSHAGLAYAVFFGGLCANERCKQSGVQWTFEQAADLVDTLDNDVISTVCDAMAETTKYKSDLEKLTGLVRAIEEEATTQATEEDKKKTGPHNGSGFISSSVES